MSDQESKELSDQEEFDANRPNRRLSNRKHSKINPNNLSKDHSYYNMTTIKGDAQEMLVSNDVDFKYDKDSVSLYSNKSERFFYRIKIINLFLFAFFCLCGVGALVGTIFTVISFGTFGFSGLLVSIVCFLIAFWFNYKKEKPSEREIEDYTIKVKLHFGKPNASKTCVLKTFFVTESKIKNINKRTSVKNYLISKQKEITGAIKNYWHSLKNKNEYPKLAALCNKLGAKELGEDFFTYLSWHTGDRDPNLINPEDSTLVHELNQYENTIDLCIK